MTKKAAEPASEEKKEAKRRLTPKQWAEAEALWESGELTLGDLSSKFKIGESGISLHMKRRGIKRGAKAEIHKRKVAEAVTAAAVDDATITAARIRETKEDHYKMATGLAKLAWAEILKAKQDSAPVAVAMNNLKALDTAMNVLTKARMERYAVLSLDKEGTEDDEGLPELLISELTADQIQTLRDRDFNEFEELGGEVVQIDGPGLDEGDVTVEED